jgi:hypothetical protein
MYEFLSAKYAHLSSLQFKRLKRRQREEEEEKRRLLEQEFNLQLDIQRFDELIDLAFDTYLIELENDVGDSNRN